MTMQMNRITLRHKLLFGSFCFVPRTICFEQVILEQAFLEQQILNQVFFWLQRIVFYKSLLKIIFSENLFFVQQIAVLFLFWKKIAEIHLSEKSK